MREKCREFRCFDAPLSGASHRFFLSLVSLSLSLVCARVCVTAGWFGSLNLRSLQESALMRVVLDFFAFLFSFFRVGAGVVCVIERELTVEVEPTMPSVLWSGVVGLGVAAAVTVLGGWKGFHHIPESHVGIYWRSGILTDRMTEPGFHFHLPILGAAPCTNPLSFQTTVVTDVCVGQQAG